MQSPNRLPMGLKCSPDFAQEVMENIFRDISETEIYIDDIGVFTNSWEEPHESASHSTTETTREWFHH